MEKFAGVGLKNIVLIWIMVTLFTLMAKVITVKYPVKGLTEVFHA
jgi:hypothetical protein